MKTQSIFRSLIASLALASLATGCGSTSLPLSSSLNNSALQAAATSSTELSDSTLNDFFSVLSTDSATTSTTQTGSLKQRWASFKSKNPDMAAKMEALKDLSPEERKAKLEALHPQHAPSQHPAPGTHPDQGAHGRGTAPAGGHFAPPAKGSFAPGRHFAPPSPEMAAQFAALKNLSPEERQAKITEMIAAHATQFQADHPEMAAKIDEMKKQQEAFKNMTPEERKAQFEAFQKAHPELKRPAAPQRPFGKDFHKSQAPTAN